MMRMHVETMRCLRKDNLYFVGINGRLERLAHVQAGVPRSLVLSYMLLYVCNDI